MKKIDIKMKNKFVGKFVPLNEEENLKYLKYFNYEEYIKKIRDSLTKSGCS